MSPVSRPPDRPNRPLRRRHVTVAPAVPCACHAPLPPLPRRLRAIEVAYGRKRGRRWWETSYAEAEPLTAADLSVDARGRLLERAELRARRIAMSERHAEEDWLWIAAELALVLPAVHPKMPARWRQRLSRAIEDARRRVDRLCSMEAMILQHESATDAWLRRQLAGLGGPA